MRVRVFSGNESSPLRGFKDPLLWNQYVQTLTRK